jgi:hypothetical protein
MDTLTLIDSAGLEVDGGILNDFRSLSEEARRQARNGYRFWQAMYNLMYAKNQLGISVSWPELFYQEDYHIGLAVFNAKFEIIDGYITPRSN